MKKSTLKWFESISTPDFFKCNNQYSHLFDRHLSTVTDIYLKTRLKYAEDEEGNIVSRTRFKDGETKIIERIIECIKENLEEIDKFANTNSDGKLNLVKDYTEPIGEGFVKNANPDTLFQTSRLEVVMIKTEKYDIPFKIITAFPTFSIDEVDDVWDAIDEWAEIQENT